jgi:hypothetical protein
MAEEFLDDQPVGGLGSIQTEPTKKVEEEAPARATESEKKISAAQKLRDQNLKLNAQIEKLMSSLDSRNLSPINEKYLAMAEGFLAPTKTGRFGESAGAAAGKYREAVGEERKRLTEAEKAKLEFMIQQYGLSQKDYELEKKIEGQQFMRDFFNKGQPAGKINTAATEATAATGSPSLQDMIGRGQPAGGIRNITLADIANAPEEARPTLEKLYDDQQNAIKIEQGEFGATKTFLPVLNESTDTLTVQQARELNAIKNATRGMPTDQKNKYFMEWYAENGLIKGPASGAAHPYETEEIETPQQKQKRLKISEAIDTERGKESVKRQAADITAYNDEAKLGANISISAKQMYDYASDPALEGMFGLLAKKGLTNSFFTAMKEPIKIGSVSIGVGNIEDVIRTAGGTDEQIAAAAAFKKPASESELAFTRIYLAKQGAITEGERAIVRNIMPSMSDPAKIVRLKSELMIARAQFDQQKADLFNAYVNKNPSATAFDFEHDASSPYKSLLKNYAEHTAEISNEYMPGAVKEPLKGVSSTKDKTKKGSSLWNKVQEQYKD